MIRYTIARMFMRGYSRRVKAGNYRSTRKFFEQMSVKYVRLPEKCVIASAAAGAVPGEWVSWRGADAGRVVLFLHGGGYVFCSPRTHRDLVCRIARTSAARVFSLEYRLAPEHPYPAALEDAVAAYRWLLDSGTPQSRIAVMGDSAGGGLTLALLQALRDRRIPLPACAVCLSPWADLTCSSASLKENSRKDPVLPSRVMADFARLYAPDGDLARPPVSPRFGDFSGLPPVLVHVGTDEILLDDSRAIAERASQTGGRVELKIWPGMTHVFQMFAFMHPVARQSIREIGEFVARHIP